jgi:hypothetical protein
VTGPAASERSGPDAPFEPLSDRSRFIAQLATTDELSRAVVQQPPHTEHCALYAAEADDRGGAHTWIMTNKSDDLPVLVIDGADFSDFDGFTRGFSRLLCNYRWRGNLDAFNDLLRRGFETPENGWVLRWLNSESPRAALSYETTTPWLERPLLTCHPSNRSKIEARISSARRSEDPTLFDKIVEIIRDHGPGGNESEDGVLLELV